MIPDNIEIDICRKSPRWQKEFPGHGTYITACLKQVILHVGKAQNFSQPAGLELSIVLTDDDEMRQLNREYRNRDRATNVLSFPSLSEDEIRRFLTPPPTAADVPLLLGDIVFGFETIDREAREQDKNFPDHFCHLCLHGILHLLGHDHIEAGQRQQMEELEKKMLLKLAIDDPYRD